MKTNYQFNASFTDINKVNPLFSKCTIRVLYSGANRNNTFISKETVGKALPSLYNIPIIGDWIEAKSDFGGHGGKLEITDQDIKFVQTTKPFGVVPESANIYWQPIAEADGVVREYLIVEGAYLWTGRYEEANSILENSKGQSMEIEILNGDFDKNDLYVINDMVFSALCILGDGVEPCFESANISKFSFKEEMKFEFTEMVKQLKDYLKSTGSDDFSKEGEKVEDVTQEEEFTQDVVEEQENAADNTSYEEQQEQQSDEAEATEEEAVVEEAEEQEAATEDTVDYQAKFTELEEEYKVLKGSFEALQAERDGLFEFKQSVEKEQHRVRAEELFVKFDKLSAEEIEAIRSEVDNYTLDQIEEKLYTVLGKKLANFSLTTDNKNTVVKVAIDSVKIVDADSSYEHYFQKHLRK